MKRSATVAQIQQISCLGLPSEIAIPAMMQLFDTLVSNSNSDFVWTDHNGSVANFYARHVDPGALDVMLNHSRLMRRPGELYFEMHSRSRLATGNLSRFRALGGLEKTIAYNEIWNTLRTGETTFLEPLAGIARVTTEIDDLTVPGASVKWDEQTSLRLSLGGRIGVTASWAEVDARFSLTGRVWHELEARNATTVQISGQSVPTIDDFGGTFSELAAGLNLSSRSSAFSAFVNAGTKWNDDYSATEASTGIRYRW